MYNIDLEEYNNGKYKYGIGELFDGDINSNIKKGEKSIFDTESKNYHFYPDDMKKMEEWNKVIEKKRGAIVKLIENDDNERIKKNQNDFNKAWSDKNDVIYFYVNNNGTLSGVEDCRLFKYIAALKNGVLYELNFMKFFISKDNKVNCIVKDIQFDRVIDDSTSIIMKKRVNRNEICYPTSYRGQSTDTLEKLLEKNQGKSFFYNPQISFDIAEADILEKFVEFIDICDKGEFKNMHISSDENNFRNKKYLEAMDKEFKRMFRAYHRYIAYRNKLLNELTLSKEDKAAMQKIDKKFCANIDRSRKRIDKEDFKDATWR